MQNGPVSDFGYTNNAIGNRTAMSRVGSAFSTPDTINYSYNSRSEVIGAVSNQNSAYNYAYSFDPIGNRLTANLAGTSYTYTTNMLNQYTVVNSNQPTYDDDGNMLTNGSWTYTWDGENRMVQAVNGNTKLQFAYDYMGRRIEKKVFDGDTVVSYKRFIYDNYKQVEELDALNSNSVLKRYSWQPEAVGLDVPLSMTDVAMAKNYAYTLDANKNVSDLTDAQGNVVAHYEYSPFGTHTATGSYTENPFRFSSEVFDSETGLIYYNYRYYNPNLGRWINRDPIEEQGGWNLYCFCNNTPTYFYDDFGKDPKGPSTNKDGTVTPGDADWYNSYDSPLNAVRKRGKYINPKSKKTDIEYCGFVCEKCDTKTGKKTYITTQVKGLVGSCYPNNAPCPKGTRPVKGWHTHGHPDPQDLYEEFSGYPENGQKKRSGDIPWAEANQMPLYLVTPKDKLKEYVPNGKHSGKEINYGSI